MEGTDPVLQSLWSGQNGPQALRGLGLFFELGEEWESCM